MERQTFKKLSIFIKEMTGNTVTAEEIQSFHDEMAAMGLVDGSEDFVDEYLRTVAKYDYGYGIEKIQWVDNSVKFHVDFIAYDDTGRKLLNKDSEYSGEMKMKDAMKVADKIKKDLDAYKVVVVNSKNQQMLGRLTTKGPKTPKEIEDLKKKTGIDWNKYREIHTE